MALHTVLKLPVLYSQLTNLSTIRNSCGVRSLGWLLWKVMFHGDSVRYRKHFVVFVEGNIGSGKTTFLTNFNSNEAHIVSEPVNLWRNAQGNNLLGKMYEDPKRWGFLFQSYVQLTMLDLHLGQSHNALKLMERSLHSARNCFVENLYRSNIITDAEFCVLDQWYQWILAHTDVEGDLVVYLRTSPEVVYERMKIRNRSEESEVPLEYLQQLHDLHEEWLMQGTHTIKPSQIIVVDANHDLADMQDVFIDIKRQIVSKCIEQMEALRA